MTLEEARLLDLGSYVEVETREGLVRGRLKQINMEISFADGTLVAEFTVIPDGLGYFVVGPEKLRHSVLDRMAEAAK